MNLSPIPFNQAAYDAAVQDEVESFLCDIARQMKVCDSELEQTSVYVSKTSQDSPKPTTSSASAYVRQDGLRWSSRWNTTKRSPLGQTSHSANKTSIFTPMKTPKNKTTRTYYVTKLANYEYELRGNRESYTVLDEERPIHEKQAGQTVPPTKLSLFALRYYNHAAMVTGFSVVRLSELAKTAYSQELKKRTKKK